MYNGHVKYLNALMGHVRRAGPSQLLLGLGEGKIGGSGKIVGSGRVGC